MRLKILCTSTNHTLAAVSSVHALLPCPHEIEAKCVPLLAVFDCEIVSPHGIAAARVGKPYIANMFLGIATTGRNASTFDRFTERLTPHRPGIAASTYNSHFRAFPARLAVSRFGKPCNREAPDGATDQNAISAFTLAAGLAKSMAHASDGVGLYQALLATCGTLAGKLNVRLSGQHRRRHINARANFTGCAQKGGVVKVILRSDANRHRGGQNADSWRIGVQSIHDLILTHSGCDCTLVAA